MDGHRETVAAGVGKAGAPIGTTDWADYVRLHSHAALRDALDRPAHFRKVHDFIASNDAWRLMNKPDGSFFSSLEEFSEHPAPWGWGKPYQEIRPYLLAAAGEMLIDTTAGKVRADADKVVELAEVPEDGRAGNRRGGKDDSCQAGKNQKSGRENALARIARDGSGDVKDLFRAGLISDRAAAALSPAKKTPEKAAVIQSAEDAAKSVVKAAGVPADAKAKRALKKKVDAVVRETLAPVVHRDVKPDNTPIVTAPPDAERDFRAAFTRIPLDRRLASVRWALGMLSEADRRALLEE